MFLSKPVVAPTEVELRDSSADQTNGGASSGGCGAERSLHCQVYTKITSGSVPSAPHHED
jgi:hypothetical protein